MKEMWSLFLLLFLAICHGEELQKNRICVIGAGRAGLAAIKLVANKTDNFELVAFERNSDVGGLWIYRDSEIDEHGLPAHSGIYKHLETNSALFYMQYSDYEIFDEAESSGEVSHEIVLEYLKNYTDYFDLRKYVRFDTLVTKVYPIKGNDDWKTTTWHLETRHLITNKEDTTLCNAVIICNGHYSKPYIPKIPGMETFPGRVLHSRSYRQPQDFTNQTVVVLGDGDSGKDIAFYLANYAKKVYFSRRNHWHPPFPGEDTPENVEDVRSVVAVNGSQLILRGNSSIVADTFIFCTGYLYDVPFLDEKSGIIVGKVQVQPLFMNLINVEHPSMIIVGLPFTAHYARLYYAQTQSFLKLLLDEEKLPSYEEMLGRSRISAAHFGFEQLKSHGKKPSQ